MSLPLRLGRSAIASVQTSLGAVGEGDAGRDGAYHEAGAVAILKRYRIGNGERAKHQASH